MESKGNIETLLALVIKSYPHKITKQSTGGAGFMKHLPITTYKRTQQIMTNFG